MANRKRQKRVHRPPIKDFRAWAEYLRGCLEGGDLSTHADEGPLQPRDLPDNVFKLSAYRYYRKLQRAELLGQLREYIEQTAGSRWYGPKETPAFWVLRLVAKPDETNVDRQRRRRLAAAFELALSNKVRPQLLLGFLYEVGPTEVIEKAAQAKSKYDWAKYYRKPKAYKGEWDDGEDLEDPDDDDDFDDEPGGQWT